jgi:hypothetical protein
MVALRVTLSASQKGLQGHQWDRAKRSRKFIAVEPCLMRTPAALASDPLPLPEGAKGLCCEIAYGIG